MKKGRKEKERKRSERRPKARQNFEKFGKWLFILLILGQTWLMCQCCSRRTAEKDGGDHEDAAGGASEREQMGRGDFANVEKTRRRRLS